MKESMIERMKSKGWCCELCGTLLKGMCDNNQGYVTCINKDCIGEEQRELRRQNNK